MYVSTITASMAQTYADFWGHITQVWGQEHTLFSRSSGAHPAVRKGGKDPYLVESLPGITMSRLPHSLALYTTLGLGRP